MILPDSGITMTMIQNAIGTDYKSIGKLIQNGDINKWSWWKPIDVERSINENVLIAENGGFSNLDEMKCDTLLALQNKVDAGENIWEYQRPTKEYRMGDFRNYNTTTVAWGNLISGATGIDTILGLKWEGGNYLPRLSQMPKVEEYDGYGILLYYHNSAFDTKYYHLGELSSNPNDFPATIRIPIENIPTNTKWKMLKLNY